MTDYEKFIEIYNKLGSIETKIDTLENKIEYLETKISQISEKRIDWWTDIIKYIIGAVSGSIITAAILQYMKL